MDFDGYDLNFDFIHFRIKSFFFSHVTIDFVFKHFKPKPISSKVNKGNV